MSTMKNKKDLIMFEIGMKLKYSIIVISIGQHILNIIIESRQALNMVPLHIMKSDLQIGGDHVTLELLLATAIYFLPVLVFLGGFISNNVFPQPLSEADEGRYLRLLAQGDEEARNILIEHNLRLVAHIIKKFDATSHDPDDLISIGTIGLIKAINTFDRGKGTKLATYAARCIENEILMFLRAYKKNKGEVSIYDPIGTDKEGNELNSVCWMFTLFRPGPGGADNPF